VEQFFVEALEQCKASIKSEKEEAYRKSLADYRQQMKEATLLQMSGGGGGAKSNIFDKTELMPPPSSSSPAQNENDVGFGRSLASAFGAPQNGPAYVGTPLTATPYNQQQRSSSSSQQRPTDDNRRIPIRTVNTPPFSSGSHDNDNNNNNNNNNSVSFPAIRPAIGQRDPLDGTVSKSSLLAAGVGISPSALPVGAPPSKIQLNDLNWEDREKVLRILFANINGIQVLC
jgi:hypothetical protein